MGHGELFQPQSWEKAKVTLLLQCHINPENPCFTADCSEDYF